MIQFEEFAKIPRYRRELCVTEKINGTNAAVQIRPWVEDGTAPDVGKLPIRIFQLLDAHGTDIGPHGIWAQSRNKFITPADDNYGFAKWVERNAEELTKLGPGTHFGEWWGNGIQMGYRLDHKRFSLFNVNRWQPGRDTPPACCHVVPMLGYVQNDGIDAILEDLRANGSKAAPGFPYAEGVVIWHSQSKQYYKLTLDKDHVPKGASGQT